MLKKYIAPSIYCEDLELNPVIGTACTDQYDGKVYHGERDGTPTPGLDPVEGVTLFFANSIDCIGLMEDFPILGGDVGTAWTFHTKSGPASLFACSSISSNPSYDPDQGDGFGYENICYNIPWFVLGKTMQS